MPTCNRVESAVRSLRTYLENSREFGIECEYVVYDDSQSATVRQDYRRALGQLRKEFNVPLLYAGLEEKVLFLRQLLSNGDLPPSVVKFSVFDTLGHGASTLGGNRNAALLDNPGRGLVTVDDDTFCRLARVPGASDQVEAKNTDVYSVSEPCEFESFADRKELLASLNFVKAPFLKIHDRVLGKSESELGGAAYQSNKSRKAILTFNGLAGDCTWAPYASYVYFFVTGEALRKLASSELKYKSARTSREIVRVSQKTILTHQAAAPGACIGMDNTMPLPPFMPMGGAEDTFYWEVKRKCLPDDFFGHLPWAVLHEPPVARRFTPQDIRRPRQGFDFYSIAKAFLRSIPQRAFENNDLTTRLATLGDSFKDLSMLSDTAFEANLKEALRREISITKERLEAKMVEFPECCSLWKKDLDICLKEYWSIGGEDFAVPVDFMFRGGRQEAMLLAKQLFRFYGELLNVWPTIVQRTLLLREKGSRLAKPV